jgi:hypothetical protein
VLGLRRDHAACALEAACARALAMDAIGYEHVRRLLIVAQVQPPLPLPPVTHEHVRGGDYYSGHLAGEAAHAA